MKPFIGLEVDEPAAGVEGLLVSKLLLGADGVESLAEASGIVVGDRLIKFGQTLMDRQQKFSQALDECTAGDTIYVELESAHRVRRTIAVVIGAVGLTMQQVVQARAAAGAAGDVWQRPGQWKRVFQCSLRPSNSERVALERISALEKRLRQQQQEQAGRLQNDLVQSDMLAATRLALLKKQQALQDHLGGASSSSMEYPEETPSIVVHPRQKKTPQTDISSLVNKQALLSIVESMSQQARGRASAATGDQTAQAPAEWSRVAAEVTVARDRVAQAFDRMDRLRSGSGKLSKEECAEAILSDSRIAELLLGRPVQEREARLAVNKALGLREHLGGTGSMEDTEGTPGIAAYPRPATTRKDDHSSSPLLEFSRRGSVHVNNGRGNPFLKGLFMDQTKHLGHAFRLSASEAAKYDRL